MSPDQLDKLNQIPMPQANTGPSFFVDLLIGLAIFAGYWFINSKQHTNPGKRTVWIIVAYAVALGFFTSSFGLVAMMWIWIGTMGGMAYAWWLDRRNNPPAKG